ncbi:Truncated hemoglobin protein [Dioscorea alata]|uniref:Truncated hemoglobin protein n=1 Tax=Dioscorea alata TaxID=55571 RepID=A0ACB7UQU9_DIOAL|nr:Truncated hemoglobin protein [Dioscorea alata]
MQSVQENVSEWSGFAPNNAFTIDETNLFEILGGIQPFIDLFTNFYTQIYEDKEDWFRSIFADWRKEDVVQNQYEFFRKGHQVLIVRHRPLPITHEAAEMWLHHMQQALDSTHNIGPRFKKKKQKDNDELLVKSSAFGGWMK